jgi:hypothetical protein
VNGARWVQQELLGPNRKARLRVYAVWFNIFPGDSRQGWRPDLLTDSRVMQYWDEPRSVGRLYYQSLPQIWQMRAPETVPPQETTLWDAYLLYGPRARWDEQPPDLVSWGSTILLTRDSLSRDLEEALK